jgi:hypothetical protein
MVIKARLKILRKALTYMINSENGLNSNIQINLDRQVLFKL